MDHVGVWLQPGFAYLHEALISRTAIAAVLAVLLAHLLQQLLLRQSIDFVVRMDISALDRYAPALGWQSSLDHYRQTLMACCNAKELQQASAFGP